MFFSKNLNISLFLSKISNFYDIKHFLCRMPSGGNRPIVYCRSEGRTTTRFSFWSSHTSLFVYRMPSGGNRPIVYCRSEGRTTTRFSFWSSHTSLFVYIKKACRSTPSPNLPPNRSSLTPKFSIRP